LGKEVVNVDDSTDVYKIAAVSTKVRYNDFWPNYSDRYMAIPLTEAQLAEINDDLYPLNTEVCLRVKPNTAPGFPERLMEQSDTQFSVGSRIIHIHDFFSQQRTVTLITVRPYILAENRIPFFIACIKG